MSCAYIGPAAPFEVIDSRKCLFDYITFIRKLCLQHPCCRYLLGKSSHQALVECLASLGNSLTLINNNPRFAIFYFSSVRTFNSSERNWYGLTYGHVFPAGLFLLGKSRFSVYIERSFETQLISQHDSTTLPDIMSVDYSQPVVLRYTIITCCAILESLKQTQRVESMKLLQ